MAEYPNYYENLEEATFRLQGTVVTYENEPVYVSAVNNHRDGILRVFIIGLPNRVDGAVEFAEDDEDVPEVAPRAVRKKINSPKFNRFRPFEMGFCNFFRDYPKAKYLSRVPVRRSKQGLSDDAFQVSHLISSGSRPRMRLGQFLALPEFRDCIVGEYPSFEETMDTLRDDSAIAVSREFAIERDSLGLNYLYYKTDKVGLVRNREVLLADRFNYLREKVLETTNLPNGVTSL